MGNNLPVHEILFNNLSKYIKKASLELKHSHVKRNRLNKIKKINDKNIENFNLIYK